MMCRSPTAPLKVASGATVLVVLTEWPKFRLLDWVG
jgi:hypothetical protein